MAVDRRERPLCRFERRSHDICCTHGNLYANRCSFRVRKKMVQMQSKNSPIIPEIAQGVPSKIQVHGTALFSVRINLD